MSVSVNPNETEEQKKARLAAAAGTGTLVAGKEVPGQPATAAATAEVLEDTPEAARKRRELEQSKIQQQAQAKTNENK